VHAVLLAAAGADDDDRRADALGARGLDQLPAVEERHHQVEHADVGRSKRSARARPRRCPSTRVEAGLREVRGHPFAISSSSSTIKTLGIALQTLHVPRARVEAW
jgi:hypothetical protein